MFINFNGKLLAENAPIFTADNRGFRYGDGFFESMIVFDGQIPFYPEHFQRLVRSLKMMEMKTDAVLEPAFLESEIKELVAANTLTNARVRLNFVRSGGGLYEPDGDEAMYLITAAPNEGNRYAFNEGLTMDVFEPYFKPCHALSQLKSANALVYVMAGKHRTAIGVDECFVLNQYGRIAEAISCNVFAVSGNRLFTPSLAEGCIDGVMRRVIIELAATEMEVIEQGLTLNEARDADEVFLSTATRGLLWVCRFGTKTFGNTIAKKLYGKLNLLVGSRI